MSNRDGMCQMVILIGDGKVIQRFDRPMHYVAYEPDNAERVSMALADAAFEAYHGLKPAGNALKADLIDRHRTTLTQRVSLILGTVRGDKKKSNGMIARDIVEVMLKEVFS